MMNHSAQKRLEKLGKRIRRLRNEHNLSQEKLADICDFDRTYISLVERGKRNLSFSNLCKFAHGLEVTVSELLRGI